MNVNVNHAVREEQAMRQVADRLTKAFLPGRSALEVSRTVTEIHHRFDGRPVRDFVPVLVERYARQELS
jgi:hypothetical protein